VSVKLLPGEQKGDLRIIDTTQFLYYRPSSGVSSWMSTTGAIWTFFIEAGESGVSYTLWPRGDSLVGSAVYQTDAVRPDPPMMRVVATPEPCPE
jgi:hypothetical protein